MRFVSRRPLRAQFRITIVKPGARAHSSRRRFARPGVCKAGRAHSRGGDARLSGLTVTLQTRSARVAHRTRREATAANSHSTALPARSAFDISGGADSRPSAKAARSFDRRGTFDEMKNGQGGYKERTHGARVAHSPWVVGAKRLGDVHPPPLGQVRFPRSQARAIPAGAARRPRSTCFFTAGRPRRN